MGYSSLNVDSWLGAIWSCHVNKLHQKEIFGQNTPDERNFDLCFLD